MSILKWLVHLSLVVQFLATKVIHVFCSQTCFCLCRIINLNIVKKYQIIDHVFYFFHQIIEEVRGITLVFVDNIGDSYNDHNQKKIKVLSWKNLHKKIRFKLQLKINYHFKLPPDEKMYKGSELTNDNCTNTVIS